MEKTQLEKEGESESQLLPDGRRILRPSPIFALNAEFAPSLQASQDKPRSTPALAHQRGSLTAAQLPATTASSAERAPMTQPVPARSGFGVSGAQAHKELRASLVNETLAPG